MAGEVVVVGTGTANTASVCAGLRRLGLTPLPTTDPGAVRTAGHVVLPGVGAFGAAMARLRDAGLDTALVERIESGRPTLAICLGLQVLCAGSEESPGVAGLGIVPARITRFPDSVRVPQLGWNRVEPAEPDATPAGDQFLPGPGYAYFANSYKLDAAPPGWQVATAEYGGRFVAALARGAVVASQFHPELSGRWGLEFLERWLAAGESRGGGT